MPSIFGSKMTPGPVGSPAVSVNNMGRNGAIISNLHHPGTRNQPASHGGLSNILNDFLINRQRQPALPAQTLLCAP
jgi:hypothetical protein